MRVQNRDTGAQERDLEAEMTALGAAARQAQRALLTSSHAARQAGLRGAAAALRARTGALLEANRADLERAGRDGEKTAAFLDRLKLDDSRIEAMAAGFEAIADRPDPLGRVDQAWTRADGLAFQRVRVPLGVIAVIFESRPNVAADAAGLAIKAGNAAILRGGSESAGSVGVILEAVKEGLAEAGLTGEAVSPVPSYERAAVGRLLEMSEHIDLLIPRGGRGLVERVQRDARMPVLAHLMGINHTYVHAGADAGMAREVLLDGKMRRPGICGATETLLIDAAVAERHLPGIAEALAASGCRLRGDERARAVLPDIAAAEPGDWDTEWLDPVLGVRVVDGLEEALRHIEAHGTGHTEAIVTAEAGAAERFLAGVDAAIVLHNASTQFADGGEFGFGAEIGIATGRVHARGPVGAEHLTSYHYRVRGAGHVRG